MYNPCLDIFRAVADTGSFSKAAEKLFVSHTAVIKQINQLEARLGVRLFARSRQGTSLTAAGRAFYNETLQIIRFSDEAIERVQRIYYSSPKTIRIGNSMLYPCRPFMELWDKVSARCPGYHLKVVPFLNDEKHLDESFDILIGAFDAYPNTVNASYIPVGKYRFCLTMVRGHRLADRKSLRLSDLDGETLQIMQAGNSEANDAVRKTIQRQYPDIHIEDIPPLYNISTFNRCVESESILLSLECWKDVHPALVTIPLKEDYYCPYGIIASLHPNSDVKNFLKVFKDSI